MRVVLQNACNLSQANRPVRWRGLSVAKRKRGEGGRRGSYLQCTREPFRGTASATGVALSIEDGLE